MSSTTHHHPAARVSGTAASITSDAGRRAEEDVSEDSGRRRSSRLAGKSQSVITPPSRLTLTIRKATTAPAVKAPPTAPAVKAPPAQRKQTKRLHKADTPQPAVTVDAPPAEVSSSSGIVVVPVSRRKRQPSLQAKPPAKRRVFAESEDSGDEVSAALDQLEGKTTVKRTRAQKKEETLVPKALKTKRMGAALQKAETDSSSSEEEDIDESKPTSSGKETRSKSVRAKVTEGASHLASAVGDTIAQRVRRDRRNVPALSKVTVAAAASTSSSAVSGKARAGTPAPVLVVGDNSSSVATKAAKKDKVKVHSVKGKTVTTPLKGSKSTSETAAVVPPPTATSVAAQMSQNSGNRTSASDAGLASNIFTALGDLESLGGDEFDVNRLQALLEARGLPSSLFSNLGPRFQQMLGRIGSQAGGSTQCYNKSMQLLGSLKGSDSSAQLAAASELSQMLVMGNEDTLHGFPIKQAVAALTAVISGEGNFELVNQAVRALSNMMDSLPRSSAVVTGAIPAFLEKLQSIEYMDVAEQSLVALEMLSRRHAKQILRANGVQAVLNYIEFFGAPAQRNALLITSACCSNLSAEEFEFVQPVLPLLSQRITQDNDKKCVEHSCVAFSRIVDCFHADPARLREIASHGLLPNIQLLLMATPPAFGSQTFIMVLQMLTHICQACPDLAAHLLQSKVTDTLSFLLTGSVVVGDRIELSKSARSPQEGFELIRLIAAILPDLPSDGIFAVDDLLKKVAGASDQIVSWFWKDDGNAWVPYTNGEAITIENAYRTQQEDVLIDTPQAQYVIDLVAFQQINEDTGTSREVRRQEIPSVRKEPRAEEPTVPQSDNPNVASFIRSIFGILYEVYCTSAGAAIRHKCSEALLKMAYHGSPELLTAVMTKLPISSNIASNLATSDVKSVIYAVQLADLLMQRLPTTFTVHFRREGVIYQMNLCAKGESVIFKNNDPVAVAASATSGGMEQDILVLPPPVEIPQTSASGIPSSSSQNSAASADAGNNHGGGESSSTSSRRAARRHSNRQQHSALPPGGGATRRRQLVVPPADPDSAPSSQPGSSASLSSEMSLGATTGTPINRIAMRIANEGRAMLDRLSSSLSSTPSSVASVPPLPVGRTISSQVHRQQATEWIKSQANKFLACYFPSLSSSQSGALGVLVAAVEKLRTEKELSALKEMKQVILDGNASPFEVIHSNLIGTLLRYLTDQEWAEDFETPSVVGKRVKRKAKYEAANGTPRRIRLMRFMHVFFDCPAEEEVETNFINIFDISDSLDSVPAFRALVAKLNSCVNQLEQFPVRVTDLTSSELGGIGAAGGRHPIMRVFAQSQLKCTLSRHPDSPNIRQWRGGMVRVEPLAPIYTVERYLVTRGCARNVTPEDNALDTDEVSDEDELDSMSMAADAARANGRYRLELLYNNNILPYNWSLYQCIRHFARSANGDEGEGDSDFGAGQMTLFTNTHTIHYRLAGEENNSATGGVPAEQNSSAVTSKAADTGEGRVVNTVWDTGVIPPIESTLDGSLTHKVPDFVTIHDPSLEVLTMLRVLFGLNYHWSEVYQPQAKLMPHLSDCDFINSKLVTKMNRQLQDPMMILTGQIPFWMAQVAVYAPFLFPFESRLQLFYVTAFDRDRAMQRLMDANPELAAYRNTAHHHHPSGSGSGHDSLLPRIERRKRTVSRKNLLAQAQTIMDEYAHCRQFLEIQYQDEVGTGLGPTLEFYSLVSKEFQRTDLGLWHDASTGRTTGPHVYAPCGLFPKPIGRSNVSKARVTEVEGKFRLLGKFMAKSVMDSRMTDITFSPVFYKWLLGQEAQLGLADLAMVDPEIFKHVEKLHRIARRKQWLEKPDESGDRKRFGVDDDLLYDGTKVEDLCLVHLLPGYDDIELCKNGRDKMVTLDNLENYVNMVTYIYLREGVHRQMEAFREAFNSVIALKYIQIFRADEMDAVFCGHGEHLEEGWDIKTLTETCHPDHGFTMESQAVKWLFGIMSQYNSEERRNFIQFVTGSPKLPVGGFKALNPPFTVVKKTLDRDAQNIDDYLPSVMTCVNYLKLPDYNSLETMRKKLEIACKEGQHSFHLS
ncbi:E3 ubiquitin-protein ligase TRIP12 [Hypsibius exemplaris]|uniref:E3 ubiquitin-protein ligase n=1 Tax=Hypsibius exemplaris TaxID=2072580 RepID=A0A1W0X1J5_HYPEX|nr:E3 ubiquitin-protein ligase TRIP12 [Hypsibius exemplaris]